MCLRIAANRLSRISFACTNSDWVRNMVYPVISTLKKKPELIFIDVLYLNLLSPTSVKFRTTRQECWHADVGQLCEERIDSIGVVNVKPNLADFVVAHVHNHRRVPTFVNFQYYTLLRRLPAVCHF